MYPGDAAQRYRASHLEASKPRGRRDAHHRASQEHELPPRRFPRGGGHLAPPESGPAPSSVDDYTAAMAKNYQDYASSMMRPEYSAHWAQLASNFWQGQYPGGPPLPGPLGGYPGGVPPPRRARAAVADKAHLDPHFRYWPEDAVRESKLPWLGERGPKEKQAAAKEEQQPEAAAAPAVPANKALPPPSSKRDRDLKQKKPADRPVVSPFQRNAVFGVDGMLVTGSSRKKAGARQTPVSRRAAELEKGIEESSGGKGRDYSLPSTRSTDTGPEESRDTSNNIGWRGNKGPARDRRTKHQYPYMHPALTKELLGEANYHSIRTVIMQQQEVFQQQVKELHRAVDLQRKLTHAAAPAKEDSPSNKPSGERGAGKWELPRAGRHASALSRLHRSASPRRRASPSPEPPAALAGSKRAASAYQDGEPYSGAPKSRRQASGPSGVERPSGKRASQSPEASDSEEQDRRGRRAQLPPGYPPAGGREYDQDYAAAAASYSYHAMMQQLAAAGSAMRQLPVPPGSVPYGMGSPYAMEYYAAMQNPAWYSAYASGMPPRMPPPSAPDYP